MNSIFKNNKRFIVIGVLMIVIIICFYKYTRIYNIGYKINCAYDAIKYQSNNINSGTHLQITINGIYKKELQLNSYVFKENIIIDGEKCYEGANEHNQYAFSDDNMIV